MRISGDQINEHVGKKPDYAVEFLLGCRAWGRERKLQKAAD